MNNLVQRILEKIQENPTFQQMRAKWDELDAQSKVYLQGAAAAATALLAGWIVIGSWWKVHSIRNEIEEKEAIIRTVRGASEELRMLRDQIPPSRTAEPDDQAWSVYFESLAAPSGVEKTSLEVSTETAGQKKDLSKESFFELTLKKVNVRQLARFAYQVENGRRPVKIRKMSVETKPDLSGYLEARISVAAYSMKNPS